MPLVATSPFPHVVNPPRAYASISPLVQRRTTHGLTVHPITSRVPIAILAENIEAALPRKQLSPCHPPSIRPRAPSHVPSAAPHAILSPFACPIALSQSCLFIANARSSADTPYLSRYIEKPRVDGRASQAEPRPFAAAPAAARPPPQAPALLPHAAGPADVCVQGLCEAERGVRRDLRGQGQAAAAPLEEAPHHHLHGRAHQVSRGIELKQWRYDADADARDPARMRTSASQRARPTSCATPVAPRTSVYTLHPHGRN